MHFLKSSGKTGQVLCLERGSPETECLEYRWRPWSTVFSMFAVFACGYLNTTFKVAPRSVEKPLGRVTDDREVRRNTAATAPIFSAATWTDGRLFVVVSFCPLEQQVGQIRTVQADGQNKRLKTGVKTVAHSVAQNAAKPAQTTPNLSSTLYCKWLICIRREYYLSDFKTGGCALDLR